MRLRVWAAGARRPLPVLVLLVVLTVLHVHATQGTTSRERHYYIAAVEIDWKYDLHRSGPTYKKVVFREYDEGFKQAKTHPSWLGLLGPTLRAEQGETIVVTFKNMAPGAYSIHPHGVAYGKQSEGANYFDNTSQKEKEDDIVQCNEEHVYTWEVTPDVSPQADDPTCLTYTYVSHREVVEDYNSGLIGTLLICKPGSLDESGQQNGIHHELVFLFGVFDEKESIYRPSGDAMDNHVKYTINGYTRGSLPDVKLCAHAPVSLHLVGMSSEPEVFSVHLNGHVLEQMGHKVSSVGLISGSTATATMVTVYRGRWLLSSHTNKHMEAGLHGFVDVEKCDAFKAPVRWMTIEQKRQSREWKYFIAAEEVDWDYAPHVPDHVDEDFKLQYLQQSPTRIGRRYKKAVYTLYSNESFTERAETKQRKAELGILGPVIRAQIRDVIKIVFKNMASRPYSIYPHGLTIEKLDEGANYPEGGNQSHAVQPGETYTYIWRVLEEDQPLEGDSRCLTRMYHSAVNIPRDIASGLIGPMLICKDRSLNVRNVQLKADKEQHAMFAVFDENKSWYLDYNIGHYCDRTKVNKRDTDFYKSNVMHTINGYVFESGPALGFCNGEVATWHVSSIGAQDYIQTATFYGHPFELNERQEDYLSLYPMTGETITMAMYNIGIWLLASLNSHETTKGMRVKFQDVECYRDYEYEYEDTSNPFNAWSPDKFIDVEKKKESEKKEEDEKKQEVPEVKITKSVPQEPDDYTAMFAEELGLRSLRNQTVDPGVEKLDLSFLDYDAVNVPDGDMTNTKNFTKKRINIVKQPNTLNETEATVDGSNLTAVNLLDQSIIENTTHVQHTSDASMVHDSTLKTIIVYILKALLNNDGGAPLVPADLDNDAVSNKENSTTDSNTDSSVVRGVSTEMTNLTNPTVTPTGNASSPVHAGNINDTATTDDQTSVGTIAAEESAERRSGMGENGGPERQDSSEEVIIILTDRDNTAGVIKTTSVKTQAGKWTYDGKHEVESKETPDHMVKYLEIPETTPEITAVMTPKPTPETNPEPTPETTPEPTPEPTPEATPDPTTDLTPETTPEPTPETTPTPAPTPKKKKKRVTLRQRPHRGEGMKTKRRKEYKPLPRSGLPSALPFSPRGFNPIMTPRGSRPSAPQPFSDEEELINMPVVIGVPRPDFSDYELYVPGNEPDHLGLDEQDVRADEYEYVTYKDPYSGHEDIQNLNLDETTKYYLKVSGQKAKMYFIAAEEVKWDYAGYGQRRQDKMSLNSRETSFTKVVFRRYLDSSFSRPDVRGELDEHLGILGPVIKAEVGENILVTFRNNANRPYSIHPNGVTYAKQTEGLSYEDGSKYWYKYDNEVQPNTTFTYLWKVDHKAGPTSEESDCRTWTYYSGVNPERDIHSGLIGPLLVCREGTLSKSQLDMREFVLLFMTFDESQSWYNDHNRELIQRKTRRRTLGPIFKENLKFHSINGIIFNLKGLRMYTNQLARWHLINMGSPDDYHSVHFHGQTFLHKQIKSYRQAVFPLLPGSFATLEMYPSRPGLWQLETEVGSNQKKGMQTLFLVLDNDCSRPLGLQSGSVTDEQITATNTRGYWVPHLARLNNQGKYNAWSTDQSNSWIQVDFQRPVVISQVATQGAKQMFQSQYVEGYLISYSTDRRSWTFYKGDSNDLMKVFDGNREAYEMKKNTFFPPVVGRFIRLHPLQWYNKATVRMEFYGCELDGCSVPLGIESRLIEDQYITASSTASSWYSGPWTPSLARLNTQGTINAWQAKYNDMNQWLQVELPQVKKITGIITQGAKSLGKEMYVMTYSLQYSNNGIHWIPYSDDEDLLVKTFSGNTNNNDHVKNYIYPPIFSRFIRIIPRSWTSSITMRIELLGCDFE